MMLILKFICLFIGITLSYVNTCKCYRKEKVEALATILQGLAIAGFITLQWLM